MGRSAGQLRTMAARCEFCPFSWHFLEIFSSSLWANRTIKSNNHKMKRGFLVSEKAPSQARPATAGRPKKTPEELERERDAVIMSRLSIDQAIEYEALREDIATEKQTVRAHPVLRMHTLTVTVRVLRAAEELRDPRRAKQAGTRVPGQARRRVEGLVLCW